MEEQVMQPLGMNSTGAMGAQYGASSVDNAARHIRGLGHFLPKLPRNLLPCSIR